MNAKQQMKKYIINKTKKFLRMLYLGLADISMYDCGVCKANEDPLKYVEGF